MSAFGRAGDSTYTALRGGVGNRIYHPRCIVHIQLFGACHQRTYFICEILTVVALVIFLVSLGLGICWIFASGN